LDDKIFVLHKRIVGIKRSNIWITRYNMSGKEESNVPCPAPCPASLLYDWFFLFVFEGYVYIFGHDYSKCPRALRLDKWNERDETFEHVSTRTSRSTSYTTAAVVCNGVLYICDTCGPEKFTTFDLKLREWKIVDTQNYAGSYVRKLRCFARGNDWYIVAFSKRVINLYDVGSSKWCDTSLSTDVSSNRFTDGPLYLDNIVCHPRQYAWAFSRAGS
jgi:hypothetical protein